MSDTPRQAATTPDSDFTLSIEQALELYAQAGLPRTPRSIQRYCAKGHLQARLIETEVGEKYLINPDSVAKHIAYIREVTSVATGRDMSGPVATGRDTEIQHEIVKGEAATGHDNSRQGATSGDQPRQPPTSSDNRYIEHLEKENEFLRSQIGAKDTTITALLE